MTNDNVIRYFLRGMAGNSMNLSTDGKVIRSYNVVIGKIDEDGSLHVDTTFYSRTTSKHRNMLLREAKELGYKIIEEEGL